MNMSLLKIWNFIFIVETVIFAVVAYLALYARDGYGFISIIVAWIAISICVLVLRHITT